MKSFKNILLVFLISSAFSLPAFSAGLKPIVCKDLRGLIGLALRQQVSFADRKFDWNNADCKIIGTKSIFPKKDKLGKVQFEKGLQLFVYQNYKLKFMCLPG